MCVVSLVMDHYSPLVPNWPASPGFPGTLPAYPSLQPSPPFDVQEVRKLIEEFKQALEAAKAIDRLTKQPDCEDPEKVKLVARVAELERQLEIYRLREMLQSCVDACDRDEDMTIVTNRIRDYLSNPATP